MSCADTTLSTAIDWFRAASPYINAHRNKTLVLALPSECLNSALLPTLSHDLTLLSHLGIRLVLCFGLRNQIDQSLAKTDQSSCIVEGRRVTTAEALNAIITASGDVRSDLEARLTMGLPNTPMAGARLSVSSGNFVTARPFGVHNGVDFQHTGAVREVHGDAIKQLLQAGHLVLIPPLGYSLTGDVFNISMFELASECAIALNADKLIFFVGSLPADSTGQAIRQASVKMLESGVASTQLDARADCADSNLQMIIPQTIRACREGVERVHLLLNSDPNALLTELFTRDGSGTMITAELWEHIRKATIQDVGGIVGLIEPLQTNGSLVYRSREQLELDIEHFVVSERDGMIISCAAMYPHEDSGSVEIACLATHPDYQGEGRAEQLLNHLENQALHLGFKSARVLSTQAGHWFVERGYVEMIPEQLPAPRRASYNRQRNSKIYSKDL